MLRKTIMLSVSVLLAVCVGCQSHVQNKKAAKERWDKASAQIKLALAQQQYDNGKYEEATKAIQECISADPENPVSRVLYGKLLLASGRCSEAKEQLSFALKSEEKLHDGWYWLGVAEQESRNYQKAYECYNKALLLEPAKVDYILAVADAQVAMGDCVGALKLLSEKETTMPREVSLKVAAADLMFRQGDTEEAIKLYEEAALLAEDSGIAESLGYSYILDKRWERAAEVFEGLVAQCKDPERSKLLLRQLAVCNMNAKRYDKALSCYSKLVVEERENARFWLKMGEAALGTGAETKALMCGQKALALQPGYPDAIALVGCAQYAGGDYTAAAETFGKITSVETHSGFAWLIRARCYERLGQKNNAEDAYKKALEMNPKSELANLLVKDMKR